MRKKKEQVKRIYLKKKVASTFSREQLVSFVKLLQIMNNLHFWLKLRRTYKIDNTITHEFTKLIELNNYCIGSCVETIKTLIDEKCGIITIFSKMLTENTKSIILEIEKMYNSEDEYIKMARQIRDTSAFHFDGRVIKEFFNDDIFIDDLFLGYMTGENLEDSFFQLPYDFYVSLYSEALPKEIQKKEVMEYIFNKTSNLLIHLIKIIYQIISEVANGEIVIRKENI